MIKFSIGDLLSHKDPYYNVDVNNVGIIISINILFIKIQWIKHESRYEKDELEHLINVQKSIKHHPIKKI